MSSEWIHSHVASCRTGTMQCTVCNLPITEGRYRHRVKHRRGDWGYVNQHEACSTDDLMWAEWDRLVEAQEARLKALSIAAREFKAKWGVDELDDLIFEGDRND